jgi:RNA polymerase sigma-70 factor (ECF subfamily)
MGGARRPDARGGLMNEAEFRDQLVTVLPRLRRFARGLTGAVTQADDLVQSACERALTRQQQFQEGTRFDSWMFRIVQTIWIDLLRSRAVRKEDGEEIDEERYGNDEPVRQMEARLALAEVQKAILRLPEEQRAVLMLVTVEGFSYREAADIAGIPLGTVMSRLARARAALVVLLDQGQGLPGSSDNATARR